MTSVDARVERSLDRRRRELLDEHGKTIRQLEEAHVAYHAAWPDERAAWERLDRTGTAEAETEWQEEMRRLDLAHSELLALGHKARRLQERYDQLGTPYERQRVRETYERLDELHARRAPA